MSTHGIPGTTRAQGSYEVHWSQFSHLTTQEPSRIGSFIPDRYSVLLDLELPEWRDRANAGHDEWVYW